MKVYLRYKQKKTLGLINSSVSNAILSEDGKSAFTPCLESVNQFNLKQGLVEKVFSDSLNTQVTCLAKYQNFIGCGYQDGSVRVFMNDKIIVFNGHRFIFN